MFFWCTALRDGFHSDSVAVEAAVEARNSVSPHENPHYPTTSRATTLDPLFLDIGIACDAQ